MPMKTFWATLVLMGFSAPSVGAQSMDRIEIVCTSPERTVVIDQTEFSTRVKGEDILLSGSEFLDWEGVTGIIKRIPAKLTAYRIDLDTLPDKPSVVNALAEQTQSKNEYEGVLQDRDGLLIFQKDRVRFTLEPDNVATFETSPNSATKINCFPERTTIANRSKAEIERAILRCPYDTLGGATEYQLGAFLRQRKGFSSPYMTVEYFLSAGCTNDEFLWGLVEGLGERLLADIEEDQEKLLSGDDPFMPATIYLRIAEELYVLGQTKPLETLLANYRRMRDANDPRAAVTLAVLGGIPDTILFANLSQRLGRSSIDLEATAPKTLSHPLFALQTKFSDPYTIRAKLIDPYIDEVQEELRKERDDNLSLAVDADHAAAIVFSIAGGPRELDPCLQRSGSTWNTRKYFLRLDDPEGATQHLRRLVEGVIASGELSAELLGAVQNLAFGLANIASDCAFSSGDPGGGFGIQDDVFAHEMVQIAASTPMKVSAASTYNDDSLAIALVIEMGPGDDGRHYAAARFLIQGMQNGPYDANYELYDSWVPRFSNMTIREAQRILQEYGLYTSGIDGVAGVGFREAIDAINCWESAKERFPNACLLGTAEELRSQPWARPYLTGPR